MKSLFQAAAVMALAASPAFANCAITVSSNNTPADKKVLSAVSEAAFERLGCTFKLLQLPSERSLKSANDGDVDGEGLRIAGLSAKYPNLVQIAEPFTRISFSAFATDPTIEISGWDSLKDLKVAYITGWKMFEANASGARTVNRVDSAEQMFNMLNKGRIDVLLYTQADGLAYVAEHGLSNIVALKPALKEVDLYLYLHTTHVDLAADMAAVIKDMKVDGSYDKIISSLQP